MSKLVEPNPEEEHKPESLAKKIVEAFKNIQEYYELEDKLEPSTFLLVWSLLQDDALLPDNLKQLILKEAGLFSPEWVEVWSFFNTPTHTFNIDQFMVIDFELNQAIEAFFEEALPLINIPEDKLRLSNKKANSLFKSFKTVKEQFGDRDLNPYIFIVVSIILRNTQKASEKKIINFFKMAGLDPEVWRPLYYSIEDE